MEKLNRYHVTFNATCPNNGADIPYDLTIDTRLTIMVEDLVKEVQSIKSGFHEDIADRLAYRFFGRQTLKGHQHGVVLTTVRQAPILLTGRLLFEQIPVDAEFQFYGEWFFKRSATLAMRATKKFPQSNPDFIRVFGPYEHVDLVGGIREFVRRYGLPAPSPAEDTLPTLTLPVEYMEADLDEDIAPEHLYQAVLDVNAGDRARARRREAKRATHRKS